MNVDFTLSKIMYETPLSNIEDAVSLLNKKGYTVERTKIMKQNITLYARKYLVNRDEN